LVYLRKTVPLSYWYILSLSVYHPLTLSNPLAR